MAIKASGVTPQISSALARLAMLFLLILLVGCGSTESASTAAGAVTPNADEPAVVPTTAPVATADVVDNPEATPVGEAVPAPAPEETPTIEPATDASNGDSVGETSTFLADVWADNWFAMYINGELVAEDSVPITTERSFNKETFEFTATYPLTIAVEAKDFKQTDSGIEYIGAGNQQMGDGGLILQITDLQTGQVVAVSDQDWVTLVVHQAPLNKDCEKAADPDTACEFLIIDTPSDWTSPAFDDAAWTPATEWSAAQVGPKDGYDQVAWDATAKLIWGTDLEVDNTILLRITVGSDAG